LFIQIKLLQIFGIIAAIKRIKPGKMKIIIINGPNLNLLGVREKSIYGQTDFETYLTHLQQAFPILHLDYYQSNVEGELVNKLHETGFSFDGIIINAGAYTHTSVALRDAISAITTPVVEVHISNILTRESFRHESIIGPACRGSIMGFGLDSYRLGIESFLIKG
jgi:3-dehydroquinate dehydratase II